MNKKIILIILPFILAIFLASFVSADSSGCKLNVSLINQDPYPAVPGSYVDVLFQVTGVQDPDCKDIGFELLPEYPFSLDNNSTFNSLETSIGAGDYKLSWMIPYKLRVDKNALDSNTGIEIRYGLGEWISSSYFKKRFDVEVNDPRTNFDAVIQDVTATDVSISLANTGKHVANSVIIRIPQQTDFTATTTDGQMLGNLNSGDYTIASFGITKTGQKIANRTATQTKIATPQATSQLKFDIYYTDNIGERRVVNMELPLKTGAGNFSTGGFAGRGLATTTPFWANWYIIVIVILVLAVIFMYTKYHKQKKRNAFYKANNTPTNKKGSLNNL